MQQNKNKNKRMRIWKRMLFKKNTNERKWKQKSGLLIKFLLYELI